MSHHLDIMLHLTDILSHHLTPDRVILQQQLPLRGKSLVQRACIMIDITFDQVAFLHALDVVGSLQRLLHLAVERQMINVGIAHEFA